jgi:hypothetical protein
LKKELIRNEYNLQLIIGNIRDKKKRLSVAFVVFESSKERNRALQMLYCVFVARLFLKLCTCLSKSAIRNQHVSVMPAMAPDDIKWENLENPYLRTKGMRVLSFSVCILFLIFGVGTELVLSNRIETPLIVIFNQLISSLVIFIINFLIINFLELSSLKIEAWESNTEMKLSLIRKITFFMFINVSISPFFIILYNYFVEHMSHSEIFVPVTFTILLVGIENFFKPIFTVVSVPRIIHWFKCSR